MAEVEKQMATHGLTGLVVGIERTGRWHQPIKQMVEKKWPVKMIHPFTTKQLRQPASSGIKTDPIDLNRDSGGVRNFIDALVRRRLEHEGLPPSEEADRTTLLRRLSFTLIGLQRRSSTSELKRST